MKNDSLMQAATVRLYIYILVILYCTFNKIPSARWASLTVKAAATATDQEVLVYMYNKHILPYILLSIPDTVLDISAVKPS